LTTCDGPSCAPLGCYLWLADQQVYWNDDRRGTCTPERQCLEKNTFLTAFKPLRTGDACGPMEKIRESAYTTLAECAVLCQGYGQCTHLYWRTGLEGKRHSACMIYKSCNYREPSAAFTRIDGQMENNNESPRGSVFTRVIFPTAPGAGPVVTVVTTRPGAATVTTPPGTGTRYSCVDGVCAATAMGIYAVDTCNYKCRHSKKHTDDDDDDDGPRKGKGTGKDTDKRDFLVVVGLAVGGTIVLVLIIVFAVKSYSGRGDVAHRHDFTTVNAAYNPDDEEDDILLMPSDLDRINK